MNRYLLCLFSSFLFVSCAQLHHVQIGEVVSEPNGNYQRFDIKVSDTGVDIGEATQVAKIFMNQRQRDTSDAVAGIVGLFQMGPRTGNPVYSSNYTSNLIELIYAKCPSGNITGLTSIRETRKYPVISGEIVKVTGYCITKKGA